MPEWDPYKCSLPAETGFVSNSCSVLKEVRHIVHVGDARRILEDGRIKSGLIYDESRLNQSRLCVSWVSANTWAYGSIYGNVEFVFDWKTLLEERRIYWVEAMTDYNPTAYRFLLTDRNLKSKHITPYDPESDDGPLRKKKGKWYWNGEFTSEFMIEDDISLTDCTKLNFIDHHDSICRLNGPQCPARKQLVSKTGGQVLACILGNGLDEADHALLNPSDDEKLHFVADGAVGGIWRALGAKSKYFTGVIMKAASRRAILRGALALYGSDQKAEAKKLVALLKSQDIFEKALEEVVRDHFGFKSYSLPD